MIRRVYRQHSKLFNTLLLVGFLGFLWTRYMQPTAILVYEYGRVEGVATTDNKQVLF